MELKNVKTAHRDLQPRLVLVKKEAEVVSANLTKVQKQAVKSAKAPAKASRQLTEVLCRDQVLETEVTALKSQMGKATKSRDGTISSANEQGCHMRIHKACISLSKYEVDSLKRMKTTRCDTKVVDCKGRDAEGKMNNLDGILRRTTFESYASIRRNVD